MQLDHITFACQSLEQAQSFARQHFGVALPAGGAHPAMGTHNLLTRIAPSTFLEFIAIDPAAASPTRPRWFNLDEFAKTGYLRESPQLVGWVASVPCLDAALATLPFASGEVLSVSRGDLTWRMAVPADGSLPHGGFAPTLMHWSTGRSPVAAMQEVGISLQAFEIYHPNAHDWHQACVQQGWLGALADHRVVQWHKSNERQLKLKLDTPNGCISLASKTAPASEPYTRPARQVL